MVRASFAFLALSLVVLGACQPREDAAASSTKGISQDAVPGPPAAPPPHSPIVFGETGVLGFSAQTPFSQSGIGAAAPGYTVVADGPEAFKVTDGGTVLLTIEKAAWGDAVDRVWSEAPAATGPGGVKIGAVYSAIPSPFASYCAQTAQTAWDCSDAVNGIIWFSFASEVPGGAAPLVGVTAVPPPNARLVRMAFVTGDPETGGEEP
jgi:hypothetical protein